MALADEYVDWILQKSNASKTPATFFSSRAFKTSVKQKKQEWFNNKAPDSLQKIIINSIVKDRKSFLMPMLGNICGPENPFTNLPKTLAGELLAELQQGDYPEKLNLVLQLLNRQTTAFDYSAMKDPKLDVVIFRHMLLNCPKVQKVEVSYQVWVDHFCVLLRTHPDDLFPMMATQWKNLSFLSLRAAVDSQAVQERFSSVHSSLVHAITLNLPNLRGLEMCVTLESFGPKEVTLLSKMQHLKYLSLTVCSNPIPDKKQMSIIVLTAGMMRKLEKFAFNFKDASQWPVYYTYFVDEYGKRYSKKKLTIESIWICKEGLEKPWPKALAVEDLHLKELSNITNIMAMVTPVQKLHLESMPPQSVHSLLEKFGPMGVNTLDITNSDISEHLEGLDILKVLTYCPHLIHILICISAPILLKSTVLKVTPDHFRKCKYFAINYIRNDYLTPESDQAELVHLQKQFFLGSEALLKSLMLSNLNQLKALEFVLQQETRTCLDELREVGLFLPYEKTYFPTAAKMVLSLFKHSPCLKKVVLYKRSARYGKPEIPIWFTQLMQAFQLPMKLNSVENLPFYREMSVDDNYRIISNLFNVNFQQLINIIGWNNQLNEDESDDDSDSD